MHKLLLRQLRRHFGELGAVPESVAAFIATVDATYKQFDADRGLLEHSMETVSVELVERHRQIEQHREQLADAQHIARMGSWVWDLDAGLLECSDEMLRIWGFDPSVNPVPAAMIRARVHPDDRERVTDVIEHARQHQAPFSMEHGLLLPDGTVRHVQSRAEPHATLPRVMVGTMQDVTERRELEEQLRHSQKMDAVGRLAGGIAHDFNNLITGILFNAELLLDSGALTEAQQEEISEIHRAADRAAALTQQLLAFSRKQVYRPEVVDLNTIVHELERMLGRLLAENIHLTCVLDPRPCTVEVDRGQFEQAIVNLVVNARDAMPEGGVLTIETRHDVGGSDVVPADSTDVARPMVMLSVRDTGAGMDAATRERVFEPFFTTKPTGRGTGLGLATVYGVVHRAGGAIHVDSTVGQGTVFRIVLPRSEARASVAVRRSAQPAPPSLQGTILVVEDEAVVRDSIRRTLERRGYRVLIARHGADALRLFELHDQDVAAVLSDVVMPEISGPDLIEQLRKRRPQLKAVLMSGYTGTMVDAERLAALDASFLQKPFTSEMLVNAIENGGRGGK